MFNFTLKMHDKAFGSWASPRQLTLLRPLTWILIGEGPQCWCAKSPKGEDSKGLGIRGRKGRKWCHGGEGEDG